MLSLGSTEKILKESNAEQTIKEESKFFQNLNKIENPLNNKILLDLQGSLSDSDEFDFSEQEEINEQESKEVLKVINIFIHFNKRIKLSKF